MGLTRMVTGSWPPPGWLDYYQHTAAVADALLARQARPTAAARAIPAAVHVLAGPVQALVWDRAERASLLACLDQATGTGQHARIIALTAGIAALLSHDGPWAEAITRHATALRSARHLGDRLDQAGALTCLGRVRRLTGDYPGAARDLDEAMGIYRDIGERGGEAESVNEAGTLHSVRGDLAGAGSCHRQTLGLARQIGSSWDEAHALAGLGRCALAVGHTAEADDRLRQALEIFQRIGAAEAAELSGELGALIKAGPAG